MELKKAIVLGGTVPHIHLIQKLQQRGYFTILVDYLPTPPALNFADKSVQISTMDLEAVLELAKAEKVDLVISACVDQANLTACYVGEKLGLSVPYSYATALDITDKSIMKSRMIQFGVDTSRHVYSDSESELNCDVLRFPVFVKPVDSCGSSGVRRATDNRELNIYAQQAREVSRSGRILIEEECTGREISAYLFIANKQPHIVMISERHSVIDGNEETVKCYATTTPPNISSVSIAKIKDFALKIATAFELDNTPLHLQAFVDGDNVKVVEFAPRVGGGVSFETIMFNTGFDIIDATIDSYLNIPAKLEYHDPIQYTAVNIVYAESGVLGDVIGYIPLLEANTIKSIHFYKSSGALLSNANANRSRVCVIVVTGKSYTEISEKVQLLSSSLDVLDDQGRSIMRRDLFLLPDY